MENFSQREMRKIKTAVDVAVDDSVGCGECLSANWTLTLYCPSAVRLSSSTDGTVATRYESDLPVCRILQSNLVVVSVFMFFSVECLINVDWIQ